MANFWHLNMWISGILQMCKHWQLLLTKKLHYYCELRAVAVCGMNYPVSRSRALLRAVSGDHPAAAPRSVTSIIQPRRPATDGSQQQEIDNEPRKYKYSIYHNREDRGPGRSGFGNILKQDMHVHQTKYWNWITSTEDLEWIFLSFNIDFAKVRSLSVSMVRSVQHGMGGWHNACADIWGHGATI